MTSVKSHISISLDGFVAGPNQSLENPIGEGGMRLHEWAFETDSWREQHGIEGGDPGVDAEVADEVVQGIGAYIMGRNMFGGGHGPWDESWRGWWGEDPPFHTPVFVLTHHPREPLAMQGDTTFTFVTDGIESALAKAREVAGDKRIGLMGANLDQQFLAAGLVDEIRIHLINVLLGGGRRLFDQLPERTELEQTGLSQTDGVTHLEYRVVR
jgi:dihydrofolate reductase